MELIMKYWYIILAALVLLVIAIITIVKFLGMPASKQLSKVREWLLWAVTEAERELGGGTGQLKLRQVYDLFLVRFPWLARILRFETFVDLVDDALKEMEGLLKVNPSVKAYVEGGAYA